MPRKSHAVPDRLYVHRQQIGNDGSERTSFIWRWLSSERSFIALPRSSTHPFANLHSQGMTISLSKLAAGLDAGGGGRCFATAIRPRAWVRSKSCPLVRNSP